MGHRGNRILSKSHLLEKGGFKSGFRKRSCRNQSNRKGQAIPQFGNGYGKSPVSLSIQTRLEDPKHLAELLTDKCSDRQESANPSKTLKTKSEILNSILKYTGNQHRRRYKHSLSCLISTYSIFRYSLHKNEIIF